MKKVIEFCGVMMGLGAVGFLFIVLMVALS